MRLEHEYLAPVVVIFLIQFLLKFVCCIRIYSCKFCCALTILLDLPDRFMPKTYQDVCMETETRFETLEKNNEEVWAELVRRQQHMDKVGRIVALEEKLGSLAAMVAIVVKEKTVEMKGEQGEYSTTRTLAENFGASNHDGFNLEPWPAATGTHDAYAAVVRITLPAFDCSNSED